MFQLHKYGMTIDVKLSKGLYVFGSESASGKTYLCNLLKRYSNYGEPVCGYTYYDYCKGVPLDMNAKLVVIDRYALYTGKLSDEIMQLAETAIVLLDCKGPILMKGTAYSCDIEMPTANTIIVE